ncbi:protein SIEVE ELEMENT OCCLUSION B-like [Zingiber officinale]|uniref:protein SIEVE ELEMENT OCCLUSION B-like n=1 Tax=Zingiber officinale TaxID=94328 RepID=UPI001C4D00B9|nr:protein SIEVE ELEMENT OCCLUSION B-like [Zingiber officinale]
MAGLTSTGTAAISGLTPTAPAPPTATALMPAPTATALMPTAVQPKLQLIKSDRSAHLFSSSDDKAVVKQIIATHSPDGREIDTRSLLRLVEDILQRATPTVILTPQTHQELVDDKVHHIDVVGMLEALAYTIHRISCEITCKCSGGGDAHSTTMVLFNSLTSYTWDAKVVIAMAAFAVSYGEFWLTAQLHTVNPLAKSVALLKQLPDILEHTDALKPRFDALNNLIRVMLDVTKCIIQFKDIPSDYISLENPDMAMALAHIPTAVYWTIRSVVACSSQIISLIGLGHEYITATTEAWELSSLAHKLSNIHGHLMKQLELLYRYIGEKKHVEAFQTLLRLFEAVHIDNMKILKAMISSKDELPLVDGATKKRVSVDVLRRKIVMLFISDLDISHEELFVLIQIYNDTHQHRADRNYEVVWLPVTDRHFPWDNSKEETFNRLVSNMPWYSLYHPSLLEPAVVRYIREIWHFDKRPQLVVLDPQGKVVCPNALHMMWIWGSLAFPFTSNREEALWKDETWRLEFLVDEIDPVLLGWIREGRHVCLYGGEDIAWIRQFTTAMRRVSQEARVPLEMVYVGKSSPRDRVRKAITVIANEKLSGYWQDPVMVWFFWVRLESMWHSKMQHGRTIDNDPIMQEVVTMLTFDGGDEGWAIVSRGSLDMVKANGRKMVDCLGQFDKWKANVESEGFVPALTNALVPFQTTEHCSRLILPGDIGRIKERVVCAECKRPMEKFVLYRCCND